MTEKPSKKASSKKVAAKKPAIMDQSGHRERLKSRFLKDAGASMADYELLELLLCYAVPRRDVKPLAKALIAEFGGFSKVIYADLPQLSAVSGLGKHSAMLLKIVQASLLRALREDIYDRPLIAGLPDVIDYCKASLRYDKIEQLRVLYLNSKKYMICDDIMHQGTIDHTALYPREIVKRALDVGAAMMIIVHNHPSGDPTPSPEDIATTKQLHQALTALDMILFDHIIIGANTWYSFRFKGLIT